MQVRAAHRFSSLLAMLLCATVALAVGGMLLWHTYLVLTAQGTIDFHQFRADSHDAALRGFKWRNPFDLGPKRNWQERFDAHGRWWALSWLCPRLTPRSGNGCQGPIAAGMQSECATFTKLAR